MLGVLLTWILAMNFDVASKDEVFAPDVRKAFNMNIRNEPDVALD